MLHSLKTLYQNQQSRNSELLERFEYLMDYCHHEPHLKPAPGIMFLNFGHKSLKWLVHGIREEIPSGELQMLFHNLLCEAAAYRGEQWLYANVYEFNNGRFYAKKIGRKEFNIDDWPVIDLNGLRTLINTTTQNITNLVFRDDWADLIIFRGPDGSAGYVLNKKIDHLIDTKELFYVLEKRQEPWNRISNNLIICGGKAHKGSTTLLIHELITLAEDYLRWI